MGSIFRYIKDSALETEDSSYFKECHVCEEKLVPVYKASGYVIREDGIDDDPDLEIYVACEKCIRSGKIARFGEWEITPYLKSVYENWEELRQQLRVTPQIPLLLQRDDWVVCCNEICEFTGTPQSFKELVDYTANAKYWTSGKEELPHNFKDDGPPESLSEVSKFKCVQCNSEHWIHQCT